MMFRSRASNRRSDDGRISRRAIAIAVSLLLVFGGSSAAYAVWTSSTSTSSSAKSATVSVSQAATNFSHAFSASAPRIVGAIIVTNTSSVPAGYSVLASSNKLVQLPTYVRAWRWIVAQSSQCGDSIPGSAVGYSWEALTGTLGTGESLVYCIGVEATAMGLADSSNQKLTVDFVSRVTASSWSASSDPHRAEFTTVLFAPTPTNSYTITNGNECISIGGNGHNTPLSVTTLTKCTNNPEKWRFTRIGTLETFQITSLSHDGRIWGLNGTDTVQSQNANNDTSSGWKIQAHATGGYQLINAVTGTCATRVPQTAETRIQLRVCDPTNTAQSFGFSGV
jgi:hypothetical protein